MTYTTYDHAGWLERNAAIARKTDPKRRKDKFGITTGWHAVPEQLNPFQARVAYIIGLVFGGIYNAPIAWTSSVWQPQRVSVTTTGGDLSTIDYLGLTRFVFLCHDTRIRGTICPAGPRSLALHFHHRDEAENISEGHPSLQDAVRTHEAYLPPDHRIRYQPDRDTLAPHRAAIRAQILAERKAAEEQTNRIAQGDALMAQHIATRSDGA